MINFSTGRTSVLTLILSAVAVSAASPSKIGTPAPDLVLRDQYEKEFRVSASRGEILLLVCGDRTGSDFTGNYTEAVRNRFESNGSLPLRIIPVANLSAVPSFLQAMVKKRFTGTNQSGQPKLAILLDWEGDLERLFGFTEEMANVYLIDRAGTLQFVGAGKGTEAETKELLNAIARLVATK
jgi:hypothetical protein